MTDKRILPLVIESADCNVPEKLQRFLQHSPTDYQMESIKLWAWRSELEKDELITSPVKLKTTGVVGDDSLKRLIHEITDAKATGVVICAAAIMVRSGLTERFVNGLRDIGVDVWTAESVNPVPMDALSIA